ncbi:MAG: twin-arginine translocase subunit TatB [Erythrobacter sp.]|nr:twin-arginine translocase subunit TatB [Erythrobacter sp.]
MFGIDSGEFLLIVVVAVLVIGPKDMPNALRTIGRWVGKARKMSNHFRAGIDAMVREAELDDMQKKWEAQNEKIMREHPDGGPAEMQPTGAYPPEKQAELIKLAKERDAANAALEQAEHEAAIAAKTGAAQPAAAEPAAAAAPEAPAPEPRPEGQG